MSEYFTSLVWFTVHSLHLFIFYLYVHIYNDNLFEWNARSLSLIPITSSPHQSPPGPLTDYRSGPAVSGLTWTAGRTPGTQLQVDNHCTENISYFLSKIFLYICTDHIIPSSTVMGMTMKAVMRATVSRM